MTTKTAKERKRIAILGATGSVGTQALDVARHFGFEITAISCASSIKAAEETVREFSPKICAVSDREAAKELRARIADTDCEVVDGEDAAEYAAAECNADTVVNAITGVAGLRPTVAALKSGKQLALANKESLVTAGEAVMKLADSLGKSILPVDSEHCAIWQALSAGKREQVRRIILTASGGPFRGMTRDEIATKTAADALKHPTWNMGKKITVDSATMMNKGFEIIEAAWLFDMPPERIDVVVHPESVIHSMVEYNDSSVIAQMAVPDMRLCVQHALTAPERYEGVTDRLDFARIGKMTFFEPDEQAFPLLALAKKAYAEGGTACAALNGANEVGVELFLKNKITLPELFESVWEITFATQKRPCDGVDSVLAADAEARKRMRERFFDRLSD